MVDMLIVLACIVIFIIAAWYILSSLKVAEPLNTMIMIALVAVGAIVLIGFLLSMRGGHGFSLSWLVPQVLWFA